MRKLVRAAAMVMSLLVPVASALAESKTVGDWTAECDDTLSCTARVSGIGSQKSGDAGYRLRISRLAGEGTAWSLRFILKNVPQPMPKGELRISVDGAESHLFPGDFGYLRDHDGGVFGLAGGPDLGKLFAALRDGKRLELAYVATEAGAQTVAFPLSGLAAAFQWIDEKQSRVGASQEVDSPSGVDGEARLTASKEVTAKLIARAEAECGPPLFERAIESYWLPGSLALHIVDCGAGAYNASRFFFLERQGNVDLMYFADFYDSWLGTNILFNPETSGFDPKTGRLSSLNLGRSIGDCGSAGQWIWVGDRFRMVEFKAWWECEGNNMFIEKWPVVYKYKAK